MEGLFLELISVSLQVFYTKKKYLVWEKEKLVNCTNYCILIQLPILEFKIVIANAVFKYIHWK